LPAVRQSLNTVEETATSLFGQEKNNTLILHADLIFTSGWLAPRLPGFASLHPQVQLHLFGSYCDLDYQKHGAELKILFGLAHRSWAQCDRLFDETIYAVATPEIADSIHTADDLLKHRLLKHRLIQISTHQINWNQILQSVGIDSIPDKQLCFTDTTQIALAMAASGYCIALTRSPTTSHLVGRLGLKPCPVSPELSSSEAYYLVYQNTESLTDAARLFRNWLLGQV